MNQFKEITVGIITDIDYTTGTGHILSQDTYYLFLTEDIIDNNILNPKDYVKFRGEIINNTNRAFFIKKINKNT